MEKEVYLKHYSRTAQPRACAFQPWLAKPDAHIPIVYTLSAYPMLANEGGVQRLDLETAPYLILCLHVVLFSRSGRPREHVCVRAYMHAWACLRVRVRVGVP